MQFTEQLDKSPNQYPNDKDITIKVLGLEIGAGKGELVTVWVFIKQERLFNQD